MTKQCELEYIHYVVSIVNHCVRVKDLREVLMSDMQPKNADKELSSATSVQAKTDGDTYADFLANHAEK